MSTEKLDLSMISSVCHGRAIRAFDAGDAVGLLILMDNLKGLAFVHDNALPLRDRGIYESTLVHAYTGTRTNWCAWRMTTLEAMFRFGDREKLRAAGDPIPTTGKLTLYRGVAGRRPYRKIAGMSWTSSIERARWFAARFAHLEDPAVYSTVVDSSDVYFFSNNRGEADCVLKAKSYRKLE